MEEIIDLPIREIDTSSIQQQMTRNKEQLQIKLMVRRPISQLIEQGIIPPLKQSPILYEQTKKLERARTEDYLKHKISNRPNRQELIQHHILEDTNISPMLIAKQQQLKKAKLADNLNERLSHRPGPLELIKGNILLPSNLQIGQAVKQAVNSIEFKPTSLGETSKYPQPSFLILKKDGQQSQHSKQLTKSCNNYHFDHHCNSLIKSNCSCLNTDLVDQNTGLIEALGGKSVSNETTNGVVSVNKVAELDDGDDENDDSNHTCSSYSSDSLNDNEESTINNLNCSQNAKLKSNESQALNQTTIPNSPNQTINKHSSGINQSSKNQTVPNQQLTKERKREENRLSNNSISTIHNSNFGSNSTSCLNSPVNKNFVNRSKKNKIKIQSKNKIIKFHEYKGPPNAIKQSMFSDCSRTETAYELLLQQQQLYLQLELEMQQKQQLTNQQIVNQQLSNQRIESLSQKDQDKTNSSINSLMANGGKSNLESNSNANNTNNPNNNSNKSNNSAPNSPFSQSPMQISKDICSPQSISNQIDQSDKDDQMNTTILNTSMINTSMSNSSVQSKSQSNKNETFVSVIDTLIDINKIEEMKVNDLKQELKRVNLPVSGSKTTLIERLKNYVSKTRFLNNKCSNNSPQQIESMDVDLSPRTNQSLLNSSPLPLMNSSSITIKPVTTTQNTLYSNTISSTPITTLATLAPTDPSNLLGATTFLAQTPTILRPTFNSQNSCTTANAQLFKTAQTSLNNLKHETQLSKPRRISEPQLQHIQLHFANPFVQFATTTTQPPLNSNPLANNNSNAQQIHFLSTPALNSNDLHLFTQPTTTLLTSNNRILQSASTPFTTTNQPTTWTLQPSNNFPQLFFYPTQLATANNLVTNNANQTAATPTTSLNLNINGSNCNAVDTNSSSNNCINTNSNKIGIACNASQTNKLDLSSDSELILSNQHQPKTRQKNTKNSKKQTKTNKSSKNDPNNKRMSISLSSVNVNNSSDSNTTKNSVNNLDENKKKVCFNGTNPTMSLLKNLSSSMSNDLDKLSNPVDSRMTSSSNTLINASDNCSINQQTKFVQLNLTETKIETNSNSSSNYSSTTIIGHNQPQQTSYLQNMSSLSTVNSMQNFFTNSTVLIDKQPPPYEEALLETRQANKKNLIVSKNECNLNKQLNSTFSNQNALNLLNSRSNSQEISSSLVNEQQLNSVNNVIGMNANYSTNDNNSTNSYSCNSTSISTSSLNAFSLNKSCSMNASAASMNSTSNLKQATNSINLDNSRQQTANLINSVNISEPIYFGKNNSNANTINETNHFIRQSSSLDSKNFNSKNLEFQNKFLKQETALTDDNQNPKATSTELYTTSVNSFKANSFENTSFFESNSHDSFRIKNPINEYSSSQQPTDHFVPFYQANQGNGINQNSNCYQTNLTNNCINNQMNQQISHSISHQQQTIDNNQTNSSHYPSNHMETDNVSNSLNTNQSHKPEIDLNLDFDLLMEDFFDFECTYSNGGASSGGNKNCSNVKQEQNFMEIDVNRLTIDTNFDEFNSTITEQSLHTPTLPSEQDQYETADHEQIINNLIDTNNNTNISRNNSMIFDVNQHHFSSIGYNDHYNDLLFQNS